MSNCDKNDVLASKCDPCKSKCKNTKPEPEANVPPDEVNYDEEFREGIRDLAFIGMELEDPIGIKNR